MSDIMTVQGLDLWYGDHQALHDISMNIPEKSITALIGPSGCGKSTFLKTLNRMNDLIPGVKITGDVRYRDQDIFAPSTDVNELRREIGMVFQKPNPFPMSIYDNIAYGPRTHGIKNRARLDEIVEKSLRGAAIWDEVKDRLKKNALGLSGGQQQRLCIARALAVEPEVLLMDEPTSALDPKTTRQILELIGDINKKLGITVVIITHQMSVVKEVCNHVAILDDGEVVEEGLVSTVFSAPKSAAARHLVFPRGADIDVSDPQQQRRIRLIFRSAKTTSIPLVARLATEEGISATVISANTQKLSEEVYGSMLLGVPNAQFEQAMDFLRSIENLQVEEASVDVQ